MSNIWFRFAMGIPSAGSALVGSGIRPTDPSSEPTSGPVTEWTVTMTDGRRFLVKLPGDGRISYGKSARGDSAEVRFYRNQTTKTFDAVIPEVKMIHSQRVLIEEAPKTEAETKTEEEMAKVRAAWEERRAKEALEELTGAIVRREYAEPSEDDAPSVKW